MVNEKFIIYLIYNNQPKINHSDKNFRERVKPEGTPNHLVMR